jgi:hypothetical protein
VPPCHRSFKALSGSHQATLICPGSNSEEYLITPVIWPSALARPPSALEAVGPPDRQRHLAPS